MAVSIIMFIPIRKNNSCWQMESSLPQDSCRCVSEQEVCPCISVCMYLCKNVCVLYMYNTLNILFEEVEKEMRK